jgi:hypothetical protein
LRELLRHAAHEPDHPYIDTVTVTGTHHLVLPYGRPNGKGNNSCDPNLWWVDAYTLAARRDIDRGEELTNDYATSTASIDFVMECRCGSALCRRAVTGNDWQLNELRQRYGEHRVPALAELIAGREPGNTIGHPQRWPCPLAGSPLSVHTDHHGHQPGIFHVRCQLSGRCRQER